MGNANSSHPSASLPYCGVCNPDAPVTFDACGAVCGIDECAVRIRSKKTNNKTGDNKNSNMKGKLGLPSQVTCVDTLFDNADPKCPSVVCCADGSIGFEVSDSRVFRDESLDEKTTNSKNTSASSCKTRESNKKKTMSTINDGVLQDLDELVDFTDEDSNGNNTSALKNYDNLPALGANSITSVPEIEPEISTCAIFRNADNNVPEISTNAKKDNTNFTEKGAFFSAVGRVDGFCDVFQTECMSLNIEGTSSENYAATPAKHAYAPNGTILAANSPDLENNDESDLVPSDKNISTSKPKSKTTSSNSSTTQAPSVSSNTNRIFRFKAHEPTPQGDGVTAVKARHFPTEQFREVATCPSSSDGSLMGGSPDEM